MTYTPPCEFKPTTKALDRRRPDEVGIVQAYETRGGVRICRLLVAGRIRLVPKKHMRMASRWGKPRTLPPPRKQKPKPEPFCLDVLRRRAEACGLSISEALEAMRIPVNRQFHIPADPPDEGFCDPVPMVPAEEIQTFDELSPTDREPWEVDPTEDEIRLKCQQIQGGWSSDQRRKRRVGRLDDWDSYE